MQLSPGGGEIVSSVHNHTLNMADASPRATKRRKLDSPNAEQDSLSTTTTPPQGKRATPRTYSKRGRNAKHNEEDKENEVRNSVPNGSSRSLYASILT